MDFTNVIFVSSSDQKAQISLALQLALCGYLTVAGQRIKRQANNEIISELKTTAMHISFGHTYITQEYIYAMYIIYTYRHHESIAT